MIQLPLLTADSMVFPDVETALDNPNGLLAFGGDLRSERLLAAYSRGIFPWYSEGQPILWWSPDPRMVIASAAPHVPRRLRRWLKACNWTIHADQSFAEVIHACAQPRRADGGTWITDAMVEAYCHLHEQGHAHSIEIRQDGVLVGGIYGVAIGRMFFGESMFSHRDHASKVALLALCRGLSSHGLPLIDAQVSSEHLRTLGAVEMPRIEFSQHIAELGAKPGIAGPWSALFEGMTPKLLGNIAAPD
ncbi:MAG TPA: leucyl/phenylalanyl-tRNA--protein transferase [Dokdonella sp.]|uniref:leucyl/phenylalanyl-tRNA--protein transferase n=1 Tax=Dokdonella sp. TaxID=2291710 RepID=UPI002D7FB454|nr:leucyl/phenylalanyl-tRNA--protein transferase [Dokdonella sp.]HET9031728.1 leucyl/phenylalanyl-tRNA--protein transferase [Dokdonella sp.]